MTHRSGRRRDGKSKPYLRPPSPVPRPPFAEALNEYEQRASRQPERTEVRLMTTSSEPVERLYTPADFPERAYMDRLGFPGE
jgi:hypothetical protein